MTYPLHTTLFRQCRDCRAVLPLSQFVVNRRSSRRCPGCRKKHRFESWAGRRKYPACKACGDPNLFVTLSGRRSIYCAQHYAADLRRLVAHRGSRVR
jgi:hypothetical protein